jgi:hypothetical protein
MVEVMIPEKLDFVIVYLLYHKKKGYFQSILVFCGYHKSSLFIIYNKFSTGILLL